VRLALNQPLPPREQLLKLAQSLVQVSGIAAVDIRPRTGSVIIQHDGALSDISGAIAKLGLLTIREPAPSQPLDPIAEVTSRLAELERILSRGTGKQIDLWSVAFVGLVAAGLVQLARGQIAGPALTLFGQAATIVMTKPFRAPSR
jgi:hypothetical protein